MKERGAYMSPAHGPNIKKLRGESDGYRYQVGGWRILYEVDEASKTVRVYEISPRGDACKH